MGQVHAHAELRPASRPRAPRLLLAVLVTLALVAAACGSSKKSDQTATTTPDGAAASTDEGTPVDGGSIVVGIAAETNGWNPANNQIADTGSLVVSSVLEPLATVGADKGAKPWLADSWYPNEDFTSWVLKLHPGITFHNGEPFDATAVIANIEAYKKGTLSSLALQPMFAESVAIDPLTVQINLKQPWAAFPSSFLVGGSALMMAPKMIAAGADGDKNPVGTGPFVFDTWTPGGSFKAKKNPAYWKAGLPHLDSIEFKVIPEDSARAAALQSGDVNLILTSTAGPANDLADSFTVVKDWTSENVFIMTNTGPEVGGKPNPLSNEHARMALAYASNRQAVADLVGEGVSIPTSPWAPSNPWGMPDDQNGYVDYDIEKAKAELELYKQETGETTLSFGLAGLPDVDGTRVLQLLQSQWKEIGIETQIETLEQTAYITKIATGDYQAAFFRNYGYSDPDMNYYFWSSSTAKGVGNISINFTQFTTPALDESLNTGRVSGFPDVRKKAYDDLTRELNGGFTNVWLYRTPYSLIAEKQVRGLASAREIAFGNYQPKTWLGDLWRAPASS
jgi:peptide/nickel transport system substrate-binding protein